MSRERAGKREVTRYLVQIIDQPHQIIALQVWDALSILLPIKYID